MKKRILVIAGPTGVGESTVTNKIIKKYPNFARLVTATTRAPRLNEKDGVDYYYFSNEKFEAEIAKGNMLEYQNTRNGEVYYGSYKPDLEKKLKQGLNVIVNPDIVGAKYYKENYNATTIFITADSMESLKKRHEIRGAKDTAEERAKRLEYAKYEMEKEGPFYDYQIINKQDKLEETLKKTEEILIKEGYTLKKG